MDTPARQANTPVAAFVLISLCAFVITAVTPPFQFAISVVGHLAFSVVIGFCIKRHLNASCGRRLSVTGKAVFITGCDTGLGNAMALALRQKGFTVFAGCLDVSSEGAQHLMSNGITALHVDYLKHDTIVAAYDNIRDNLSGNGLWGLVANAGVACYGETEWMQSGDLQRVIDVNILGTYKFIMHGINQIKRSEGRVVIVTGLHGRVAIPGMVIGSATSAALCHYADGLRREMAKYNVEVCTIEPAFYKTAMTDPATVASTLNDVTRRLDHVVQEEYGSAYLDSFKLTLTKKLRRFSHQNYHDVTSAVVRCLSCRETNLRYRCSGMRQLFTWSVLEFLPVKICDFLLMHQFTPRAGLAGNIRVRNVLIRPLKNLDDTEETKPRDHVEKVLPTTTAPRNMAEEEVRRFDSSS